MTAPLIAIPARRSPEAKGHRTAVISGGRLYADAMQRAGGLPVFIPPSDDSTAVRNTIDRCDAMVLLGGGDIDPSRYGQTETARLYSVDPFLDDFEIVALHRAIERDIPVLAICRGHQLLNVALGGSLIQHIDTADHHRDAVHHVDVVPDSRIARIMGTTSPAVHCFHHQAIDRVAEPLRVVAVHADGTIEAVEHTTASWVVGVQWHPEDSAGEDSAQQALFDEFVHRAAGR
jgi:putative glutamine amidotransferase